MTWIVLGSSLTAPDMLKVARADYGDTTLITTNSGIELAEPDYYFLSDQFACKQFGQRSKDMQANGMKVITLKRLPDALHRRGLDHADILLPIIHTGTPMIFERGVYRDCMFSGLYCSLFAINNGAKRMVVVGHEGYPPGEDDPSYWYSAEKPLEHPPEQRLRYTKLYIGPWWQKVADACPDIEFVFYGDLNYKISGPNVKVIAHANTNA